MNIFVLDRDPYKAAAYHNDKHVVKMILESVQMLSTFIQIYDKSLVGNPSLYKMTHANHPCSLWLRNKDYIRDYSWLCHLTCGLMVEYTQRYGKYHKSEEVFNYITLNCGPSIFKYATMYDNNMFDDMNFTLAMPDDCKTSDPVESYRNYYIKYKSHIAVWRKTITTPPWLIVSE